MASNSDRSSSCSQSQSAASSSTLPFRPGCNLCGCPTCHQDEAHEKQDKGFGNVIVLPFYHKLDVYAQYAEDFMRNRADDKSMPLSYSRFLGVWERRLNHIKVSKAKTGWAVCDECTYWRRMVNEAATPALRAKHRASYDKHLEHQRDQRLKFYKHRLKGINFPDRYLSIILDAMDQKKCDMPHTIRSSKSSEKFLKLKQKLLAAMVHGYGTYVYISPTPVGSGANFNIEVLWRTLLHVAAKRVDEGRDPLPPILYLQLDNASDNKSKAVLAFCDAMVTLGVFKKIKIGFLLVGHTHEDIDQYFSVISRHLK